jgi:hypothetical protein
VILVVDDPREEALLEQMAFATVSSVEALRVQAVQPVHHRRQLLAGRLHDEVVVRAHHAPREQANAEEPCGLNE